MSDMEISAAHIRDGYRRFFARTAAITLLLMLALIAVEVFFPQGSDQSAAMNSAGGAAATGVDLYDFQLLIMVGALVACVSSIIGLLIVAFIDAMESRKSRRGRTVRARLSRPAAKRREERRSPRQELAAPPRNAGLRALREAVHELK